MKGGDVDVAARRLARALLPPGPQPGNARRERIARQALDLDAARCKFARIGLDCRTFLAPPDGQCDPRRQERPLRKGGVGMRERLERRSEEHTSELQSLMRNSYAVFCLKKKKKTRA